MKPGKLKYSDIIDWETFSPAPVIGVDEVGRGCLAGPVYAGAVILNSQIDSQTDLQTKSQISLQANLQISLQTNLQINLLTDSKLLTPKKRQEYSLWIHQNHRVGLGWASVEEIDELNILQASLLAMQRAVLALGVDSGHILIDGIFKIPGMGTGFKQSTFVKGDLRVAPISAASIVAKVARDTLMNDYGVQFPRYGFDRHKGYSTIEHKSAIQQYGPLLVHRKSFSGVKEYL